MTKVRNLERTEYKCSCKCNYLKMFAFLDRSLAEKHWSRMSDPCFLNMLDELPVNLQARDVCSDKGEKKHQCFGASLGWIVSFCPL